MGNILQKKIEKISQALYLVTQHLKDNEPLKWELRKDGLSFLAYSGSFSESEGIQGIPADIEVDGLFSCAQDIISLLSLSWIAGLISKNNAEIVIGEIKTLLRHFERSLQETTAKAGFVLSEDFFADDPSLKEHLDKQINKGQMINFLSTKNRSVMRPIAPVNKKPLKLEGEAVKDGSIKDKKELRQQRIVSLLQTQSNLTIKDFVQVIPDCSEKTIQRELTELVEKGIIKKEGQRRWSTYSLNNLHQ